jgi:DNA-binding NtrC family response regulator
MMEQEPSFAHSDLRVHEYIKWAVQSGVPMHEAVESFRIGYIRATVEHFDGNRSKAAHHLGIHRNTLHRIARGMMPPGSPGKRPKAGK